MTAAAREVSIAKAWDKVITFRQWSNLDFSKNLDSQSAAAIDF
jgi:hypothetical protein